MIVIYSPSFWIVKLLHTGMNQHMWSSTGSCCGTNHTLFAALDRSSTPTGLLLQRMTFTVLYLICQFLAMATNVQDNDTSNVKHSRSAPASNISYPNHSECKLNAATSERKATSISACQHQLRNLFYTEFHAKPLAFFTP